MNETLIEHFKQKHSIYKDFTKRTHELVSILLDEKNLRVHSVTSRVKEENSLEKKIKKNSDRYSHLENITDICGIRITTYFEDDVDVIANIIKEEFVIDEENSIDKRQLLDPDRFGYLSLHFVASLKANRLHLPEYRKFKDLKIEFQIRSILQHAWAEIEHDLGYKSKIAIPNDIRRNFFRVAGLLEIADLEFKKIRDELQAYAATVSTNITINPDTVLIDKISLTTFLKENSIIKELNTLIATATDHKIVPIESVSDKELKSLTFFEIKTIGQLSNLYFANKDLIIGFIRSWLGRFSKDPNRFIDETISLYYLSYIVAAQTNSLDKISEYLKFRLTTIGEKERSDLAKRIINTYDSLANS